MLCSPLPLLGTGAAVNAADTAWMLVACGLVLLMTPALAFFYGGLVRTKNALNTMVMCFASMGVVGIVWALAGYSLAFGKGNAWIGGLEHLFLANVGLEAQGPSFRPPRFFRSAAPYVSDGVGFL